MGRIDIRVPDEEITEWKQRAIEEERTLSGWVRERCKGGRAEDHRAQDMRGARKVSTPKRSSRVSERIPAPSQAGKKCLCGDAWEKHWNGGRCLADLCKCDKFEEG